MPASKRSHSSIVAACDIGTFSGLIVIARHSRRGWEPLIDEQHAIDLLADGARDGHLPEDAIARAQSVVARFDHLARAHACARGAVVCTAAIRHAPNRADVLKALRNVTKHPVVAISARREGALAVRGALIGLPRTQSRTIIVDVGGGSTETMHETPRGWVFRGIPWGASRATKAWREDDREGAQPDARSLSEKARELLASLRIPVLTGVPRLVGVGGTITTLAAINARHKRLDPGRLHGRVLTLRWIEATARRLAGLDEGAIARLIPFDPKRARVITAGTFLWSAVLNRFDANEVVVSTRGLRWGVASELADGSFP